MPRLRTKGKPKEMMKQPTDIQTKVYKTRMWTCRTCSLTIKEFINGRKCKGQGCDLVTTGTMIHTEMYTFFEDPPVEVEDLLTQQESEDLDRHVEQMKKEAQDITKT